VVFSDFPAELLSLDRTGTISRLRGKWEVKADKIEFDIEPTSEFSGCLRTFDIFKNRVSGKLTISFFRDNGDVLGLFEKAD